MVSEKEEGVGSLASPLSRAPFFSHCIWPQFRSLPSSRGFLETLLRRQTRRRQPIYGTYSLKISSYVVSVCALVFLVDSPAFVDRLFY